MPVHFSLPFEELVSMCVSLFCGFLIGLEREYRNKSTGLRTIILICLGSTLFSIISHHGIKSDDRVAANIITGIGFIGAGVIFKDKMGVLGLTTAAVIWVAAAIGMAAGFGEHSLALLATAIVLLILLFLGKLERWVNTLPQNLQITISLTDTSPAIIKTIDELLRSHKLRFTRLGISKSEGCVHIAYQLRGHPQNIAALQLHLLDADHVQDFY